MLAAWPLSLVQTSADGSSVTLVDTGTDVAVAVFVLVLENDLKSPSENKASSKSYPGP